MRLSEQVRVQGYALVILGLISLPVGAGLASYNQGSSWWQVALSLTATSLLTGVAAGYAIYFLRWRTETRRIEGAPPLKERPAPYSFWQLLFASLAPFGLLFVISALFILFFFRDPGGGLSLSTLGSALTSAGGVMIGVGLGNLLLDRRISRLEAGRGHEFYMVPARDLSQRTMKQRTARAKRTGQKPPPPARGQILAYYSERAPEPEPALALTDAPRSQKRRSGSKRRR